MVIIYDFLAAINILVKYPHNDEKTVETNTIGVYFHAIIYSFENQILHIGSVKINITEQIATRIKVNILYVCEKKLSSSFPLNSFTQERIIFFVSKFDSISDLSSILPVLDIT